MSESARSPAGDWLGLAGKLVVVAGVSNKKSVGWHIGQRLAAQGARVAYGVHTPARQAELAPRLAPASVHACDVQREEEIELFAAEVAARHGRVDGLVHSIAFANYSAGPRPFHHTRRADFLQAVEVSCYSLLALARAFEPHLEPDASVVALSISTTRMAAENYGFMAPAKAALDSSVAFLAKSFSAHSRVRFNALCAGPLKTSSSAGIPGYAESYLFAEACTLRKRGPSTEEVADAALFLLSPRSAAINAQGLVVDAGMGVNHFDREVVRRALRPDAEAR